MSITYTPTTNFGSKDVLPANDPNKVIVGAEFTSEFNAIQAAFALAAPTSNPTFSGTATYNNINVTGTSTLGVLNAGTATVGTFTSTGIDDNAASTAITIDTSQNVGIGTNVPTYTLHTIGDSLLVHDPDGSNTALVAVGSGGTSNVLIDGDTIQMRGETGAVQVTKDASGNVGIGTSSPTEKLSISGSTAPVRVETEATTGASGLRTSNTGGNFIFEIDNSVASAFGKGAYSRNVYADGAYPMVFWTNGNERMRIDESGTTTMYGPFRQTGATAPFEWTVVPGATDSYQLSSPGFTNDILTATATGRVGIGTDNPDGKLSVFSGSAGSVTADADADELVLENSGNVGLSLLTASTGESSIYFGNPGANGQKDFSLKYYHESHPDTAKRRSFTFNSPSQQLMCVKNSGNVGIGTSTPAGKLSVAFFSSVDGLYLQNTTGTNDYARFEADTSTGEIKIGAVDAASGVYFPTFYSNGTERVRIDGSGNLLVGKSSSDVNVAGFESRSAGDVFSSITSAQSTYHVYDYTGGGFKFYVSGAGVISAGSSTITVLSDERLKENVRDLDDGLEKIMALQPRKFDWKEGKGLDVADDRGFIAQELETVFPDMVKDDGLNKDENGESYKTISPNLVPTLVKAIQEQQAMIETLQAEVAALKGE